MKASGTDSSGASAQMQQELEQALNKVAEDLAAAKNSSVLTSTQELSPLEELRENTTPSVRSKVDFYEPGEADMSSPGIYRIENDGEGYSVIYSPCSEN